LVPPGTAVPEVYGTPGSPGSAYGACRVPGHSERGCTGLCDPEKWFGSKEKLWEFLGGDEAKREARDIMDYVSACCPSPLMLVFESHGGYGDKDC
jgi:hypothetical protein